MSHNDVLRAGPRVVLESQDTARVVLVAIADHLDPGGGTGTGPHPDVGVSPVSPDIGVHPTVAEVAVSDQTEPVTSLRVPSRDNVFSVEVPCRQARVVPADRVRPLVLSQPCSGLVCSGLHRNPQHRQHAYEPGT